MRRFATINLVYLAFVAGSALSSVHIDHEGSHREPCAGNEISASCHADVPHEHDATHAGQESLFEHTFENGNYENSAVLVAPAFVAITIPPAIDPVLFRSTSLLKVWISDDTVLLSQLHSSPQSSRAPPAA